MRVSLGRVADAGLGVAVGLAVLGVPWGMTLAVTIFVWRLAGWLRAPVAGLANGVWVR